MVVLLRVVTHCLPARPGWLLQQPPVAAAHQLCLHVLYKQILSHRPIEHSTKKSCNISNYTWLYSLIFALPVRLLRRALRDRAHCETVHGSRSELTRCVGPGAVQDAYLLVSGHLTTANSIIAATRSMLVSSEVLFLW